MQFVSTENDRYAVNYGKVLEMKKTIEREIKTVIEYRDWVRDFRKINEHMVGSIQFCRDAKNDIKFGRTAPTNRSRSEAMNNAHLTKLSLRPFARRLYELRAEHKERFKAGEYGDPNARFGDEIGLAVAG